MTDLGEWHGPCPWGSSGPWGGQAVSGTEWRRRPGLGGAGPGVLRAGVELGPRCSFSRPLAQQKCDSTTSDREIIPVSCCSQQAFGARSRPHLHDAGRVTRSWGGAQRPGVSVHVSCTDPSDPTTFPSAGWPPFTVSQRDRDLGRRSSCRFKEGARGVSGGQAAPASPGEAPLFSRPLPPKPPVADTPHLDPRPSVASQRPGDPSWPRRRRRRDSPWLSCFLLLPSLLSSLLCLRDPPMRKNKNEQTEHPEH